jgi:hypothetical protein
MSRRTWAALVAGTLALLALHAVLVRPVHGFLLSDTTGYLANARWIAGEAGGTWQGPSSFYHPLWSLLVAPLYLVFDAPRDVQVGALVLNALLAAAIFPAAYVLGRRAFSLPTTPALAAAGVAATYPAVLLLAGYEWAEPLYQLLFVGWVVAAAAAISRPGWPAATAVAVAAAALNATHPRGIGTVAVTAVLLVVLARRQRLVLVGLAVLAVLFVLTRLVNAALLDAIYSETSAGVEGDVLSRITDPALVWGAAKALLGQLWYLTVATLGLVPIGALWLATSKRVSRPVAWTVLAGALATLGASALQMSDGTRVDHLVYGRYVEGAVPVLLVAGAAALVAWRSELVRLYALVAGGGALLAIVLVVGRGGDAFAGDVMPLNVTGILVARGDATEVDVLVVSLVALVAAGAVVLLTRWRALLGVGAVGLLFVASSASVQARTLRPFDERWAGFITLSDAVRSLDVTAYSIDRPSIGEDASPQNLYQLELSDLEVRFSEGRPSTALVIGPERWEEAVGWGARLVDVEVEPVYHLGLWVMPGDLQDRLRDDAALLPLDPLAPIVARQSVATDVPGSLAPGEEVDLSADLTHAGGDAAWLPTHAIEGVVVGSVRVGARWFPEGGTELAGPSVDLPAVLRGGDRVVLGLTLQAPTAPGRYRLEVGARQEGIAWFDDPATFTVDVR